MKASAYKNLIDIEAGDALVEKIKPLAASTNRSGTMGGLGDLGTFRYRICVRFCSSTDESAQKLGLP